MSFGSLATLRKNRVRSNKKLKIYFSLFFLLLLFVCVFRFVYRARTCENIKKTILNRIKDLDYKSDLTLSSVTGMYA